MALHDEWPAGSRWRVAKEGAYLTGMQPDKWPSSFRGWSQDLAVGDVIECTGLAPGWGSDPGYGIHFTTDEVKAAHVSFAEFRPMAGGIFSYHPADGWLEPVIEE